MILKLFKLPGDGRARKLQDLVRIAKQNLDEFVIF
jgi:hypothetical protein